MSSKQSYTINIESVESLTESSQAVATLKERLRCIDLIDRFFGNGAEYRLVKQTLINQVYDDKTYP